MFLPVLHTLWTRARFLAIFHLSSRPAGEGPTQGPGPSLWKATSCGGFAFSGLHYRLSSNAVVWTREV